MYLLFWSKVIVVIVVGIVAEMTMGTEDPQGALHIEVDEIILPDARLMLEGRDVRDPDHILLMKGTTLVIDRGFTGHIWFPLQ